jgi:hypothetical protein
MLVARHWPLAVAPSARARVPRLSDHHFAPGKHTYKEPCLLSETPCHPLSFSPVSHIALVLCLPPLWSAIDSSSHRSPSSSCWSQTTATRWSRSRSSWCHRSSTGATARRRRATTEIPFWSVDVPSAARPFGHAGPIRAAPVITVGCRCCATVVHGELRPLHITIPLRCEVVLERLPGARTHHPGVSQ